MHTNGSVFVTGGASGIGLAVARSLLDEGWRVVIADLAQGNLDQASQNLPDGKERVRFESLDVTDEEAVKRAIARCDAELGPLAGLVNSAGIGADVGAFDTSTSLFRRCSRSILSAASWPPARLPSACGSAAADLSSTSPRYPEFAATPGEWPMALQKPPSST